MTRPHALIALVCALGLVLGGGFVAVPGPAAAAPAYPTWDDVLAARGDEAATAAAITEIEGILAGLSEQSAVLEREAQLTAEAYNIARVARDAAAAKADRLAEQAKQAQKKADESAARAGQLAAQLGRTGGGDLTLALLVSSNADDLLSQLGQLTNVSERAVLIYRAAMLDRNAAQALTDQAKLVKKERDRLEKEAAGALDAAKAAADQVNARLAEQQAASAQLIEQLASLKNTSAQVEQGYRDGLAAQPIPQQPSNPGGGGGGGGGGSAPPPNTSAAAGAISFAYAQLGDMYGWGGAGPDVWDCSGLTMVSYASVGVSIGGHGVTMQYNWASNNGRLVWWESMAPGDLIFYANGGTPAGGFYHSAIYVGNGMMIEAPRDGVPVRLVSVRYLDMLDWVARPTG